MKLNILKKSVRTKQILYDGSVEESLDADITLPDYCGDVVRVLKCIAEPKVVSVQITGERVTADGNALVRVIYADENNKICCYEQNYPFTKYVEAADADTACAIVKCKCDYINCRAVSSRRLDIHGVLGVHFKIIKEQENEVITGAEGAGAQTKKTKIAAVSETAFTKRAFTMSETAQLPDGIASISSIINTSSAPLCDEIKIINNKLLLKGELTVNIIYCCEDENDGVVTFQHSLPISQIIELEGITEDNLCSVILDVTALDVTAKADSTGENRLIDICARVSAFVDAKESLELPLVTDSYSTECELKTQVRSAEFYELIDSFKDTFLSRASLDLSNVDAQKICAVWCTDLTGTCSNRGSDFVMSGTVTAHLIFTDSEGKKGYTEKPVDFEYKRGLKSDCEKIKCSSDIKLSACTASCVSGSNTDIKIEFRICADVFECKTYRIISLIEADESDIRKKSKCALTIYFASDGEALWDIARHYKTSVEAIRAENAIDDDFVKTKQMLLIPSI